MIRVLKYTEIKKYLIYLEKKYQLYKLIYDLVLIKLEMLKIYIKINL